MSRVVASWQKNLSPQATSAQRTNYGLMIMLNHKARLRVSARPQPIESVVAKNAYPSRCPPLHRGGSTKDSPSKREVRTIYGGSREVRNSRCTREKYTHEAKTSPQPWCKPQAIAPRGALHQNQRTSPSLRLMQAGCTTLTKTP